MKQMMQQDRFRKRLRQYVLTFAVMAVLAVAAPFSGLLLNDAAAVQAAEQGFSGGENPRANYWREVRQSEEGYTAVQGREKGVLIQNGGQNWRALRNGPVANYGGWVLGITLAALALFYFTAGRVELSHGRSGQTVTRWSAAERALHWFTAISFIVLGITGLSLLFGRAVLIPVLGKEAFAAYAVLAKDIHNYLGPAFGISLVLFLLKLLPHNFPDKHDLAWFKAGGGMIGKAHPSAGRMNAGEKVWFWALVFVGGALVVTGVFLDFSAYFEVVREDAQNYQLVHAIAALGLIAFSFGHIYIGTIGTDGALEGMVSGEVDVNWAKQHHDLWYAEVLRNAGSRPSSAIGAQGAQAG